MRRSQVAAAVAVSAAAAVVVIGALLTPAASDTPADALSRGAALAEDVGQCSTCHGAVQGAASTRIDYAGARVDDWYAPAINAEPDARLPWTEAELYVFLRTGSSPLHGIAVGPMSEVVHGDLAGLPDEDIAALAAYFANLGGAPAEIAVDEVAAAMRPEFVRGRDERRGEWLYVGYCVSCHFNRPESQTGKRPELALNTAVSAPDPTNLIRIVLAGVSEPEGEPDEYMPGFAMLLSDRDVADVAAYLRAAYASGREPWSDLEPRIAELRALRDPMR
jgi:mono/diheme cytochrome c family protein